MILTACDKDFQSTPLVALTVPDLVYTDDGILDGYALELTSLTEEDLLYKGEFGYFEESIRYYFIHAMRKNTYGCGAHDPTGIIYRVGKAPFSYWDGDGIDVVAYELPREPRDDEFGLCID